MMMASRMIGLVWIEQRAAGRLDHRQLGIGIHAVERLRRADMQRERHHQIEHRRNERRSQREESEQRLARRGQQIDVDQHLRDQHHHRRRRQRHQRQRQGPPENVPLEQIHRAFKEKRLLRKRRAPRRVRRTIIPIPRRGMERQIG